MCAGDSCSGGGERSGGDAGDGGCGRSGHRLSILITLDDLCILKSEKRSHPRLNTLLLLLQRSIMKINIKPDTPKCPLCFKKGQHSIFLGGELDQLELGINFKVTFP